MGRTAYLGSKFNVVKLSVTKLQSFVSVTVLWFLFLSVGLGDGWGQSTRFSPLDNMTKELGSHLLQVSTGSNKQCSSTAACSSML